MDGDVEQGKVEAGQSAALIDALLPAAEVVERTMAEACEVVARLKQQLG